MNGRTCQLCGKPLSRIRVGAGGDFCSREHRNQYRLRCGMDRLLEANQMSSLMRRSEHLKPLPGHGLQNAGNALPRPFLDSLAWKSASALRCAPPMHPLLDARVRASAPPVKVRAAAIANVAVRGESLRAKGKRSPQLPVRAPRLSKTALRASVALLRYHVATTQGNRRVSSADLRLSARPVLKPAARALAANDATLRSARAFVVPARKGQDLRVCAAAGFRLPARLLPQAELSAKLTVNMVWPGIRGAAMQARPSTIAHRVFTAGMPVADTVYLAPPIPDFAVALPGLVTIGLRAAVSAVECRAGQAPFLVQDPLWLRGAAGQEEEDS